MLYSDKLLQDLWDGMRDIPFDEDGKGELYISKDYGPFKKGEWREDIWRWFDNHHSEGLYFLMGLGRQMYDL
jgi:hypothetical protein